MKDRVCQTSWADQVRKKKSRMQVLFSKEGTILVLKPVDAVKIHRSKPMPSELNSSGQRAVARPQGASSWPR